VTRDEAGHVLRVLVTAFPQFPMPDETAELWLGFLVTLNQGTALDAAEAIVLSEEWFPPVAKFRDRYMGFAQQERMRAPALPAAPEEPMSRDHIDQLRDQLARIGKPVVDPKWKLTSSRRWKEGA